MLHPSTFEYLKPTEKQMEIMAEARMCHANYANRLDELLPDGPDKTWIMRELRTLTMWCNVAITRHSDGAPRQIADVPVMDYPADHPVEGDLGSVPP